MQDMWYHSSSGRSALVGGRPTRGAGDVAFAPVVEGGCASDGIG